MTKSTITRERIQRIIRAIDSEAYDEEEIREWLSSDEIMELSRMALAALDSESGCLPLDYLQGHKDGLEWASQLAEANHPETGDWLYDDPIELAKAIRKGPDMPPVQPVADSEPVAYIFKHPAGRLFWSLTDKSNKGHDDVMPVYASPQPAPIVEREPIAWLNDAYLARGVVDGEAGSEDAGPGYIPVYREAGPQPATVVPDAATAIRACLSEFPESARDIVEECADIAENACRAAMLAAAPQSPGSEPATVPGKWIPVSERMPEEGGRYWCYVEEQNSLGKSHYQWNCSWNGDVWSDKALTGRVTHWMPLPAAPQEAINALISVVSRNEPEGK